LIRKVKYCPHLSDVELILVDLTAESLNIDSEYKLLGLCLIHCVQSLNAVYIIVVDENCFILKRVYPQIDVGKADKYRKLFYNRESMPLEICKL
jgi:hypothetical protein